MTNVNRIRVVVLGAPRVGKSGEWRRLRGERERLLEMKRGKNAGTFLGTGCNVKRMRKLLFLSTSLLVSL